MLLVFSRIVHLQVLPTLPVVIVTSTLNITKGLGIKSMKELQPSVSASCCRRDRHVNNQVDIKSKATTIYGSIYTNEECAQTSAQTMFVHVWLLAKGR